jgi:hypothetical protein
VFTGRYPRPLFGFNLGVLRWSWRVGYYTYSVLGTDRYTPFSLGPEPGYPATLDVAYPERLSQKADFGLCILLNHNDCHHGGNSMVCVEVV